MEWFFITNFQGGNFYDKFFISFNGSSINDYKFSY